MRCACTHDDNHNVVSLCGAHAQYMRDMEAQAKERDKKEATDGAVFMSGVITAALLDIARSKVPGEVQVLTPLDGTVAFIGVGGYYLITVREKKL